MIEVKIHPRADRPVSQVLDHLVVMAANGLLETVGVNTIGVGFVWLEQIQQGLSYYPDVTVYGFNPVEYRAAASGVRRPKPTPDLSR